MLRANGDTPIPSCCADPFGLFPISNHSNHHLAVIALGSNMGDRLSFMKQACDKLAAAPCLNIVAVSSVYESEPADCAPDDPAYANAVIVCTWRSSKPSEAAAKDLLNFLLKTESLLGRERPYENAPRTIDLDLLVFDDVQMQSEFLTLPHPRMFERDFVMTPLREVASYVRISDELLSKGENASMGKITSVLKERYSV
jgi:2-amino-4-hydroxy-6-hydroxymethyldihydropteridine diphosphokinase